MQNISQGYHNSFCRDRTLCSSDILRELFVRMAELFGQWPDTAGTNVSLDTQMHCCRFRHTDIMICKIVSQQLLSFSLLLNTCTFFLNVGTFVQIDFINARVIQSNTSLYC